MEDAGKIPRCVKYSVWECRKYRKYSICECRKVQKSAESAEKCSVWEARNREKS
jgi:hypothetical protein